MNSKGVVVVQVIKRYHHPHQPALHIIDQVRVHLVPNIHHFALACTVEQVHSPRYLLPLF